MGIGFRGNRLDDKWAFGSNGTFLGLLEFPNNRPSEQWAVHVFCSADLSLKGSVNKIIDGKSNCIFAIIIVASCIAFDKL